VSTLTFQLFRKFVADFLSVIKLFVEQT